MTTKKRKSWTGIELCDREPLPAWLTDLWHEAFEGKITWQEFTEQALVLRNAEAAEGQEPAIKPEGGG